MKGNTMKILLMITLMFTLSACTVIEKTAGAVKYVGCDVLAEESREDIRDGMKYKTNICNDDLSKWSIAKVSNIN